MELTLNGAHTHRRMKMTALAPVRPALTNYLVARFGERAATYDRENRFFDEDFEELRRSGYLDIAIPEKFGGPGLRLSEALALQRRLAYVAPATALGVNMHLYFTGTAADLHRAGDPSCD